MAADPEILNATGLFGQDANEEDVRRESRAKEWADGARFTHWVGIVLLGSFLVTLLNATPFKLADITWQLGFISLLMNSASTALLGTLLISLARLFNLGDRQIQNRALLVRTLASWVAIGWFLLIPLQLYLGVRLINSQAGQELGQIKTFEGIARSVRNASTEDELRAAIARIPNQPPLPRLTVPLEIAKANLLAQFQKTINTAKNRQERASSNRWQTWMQQAFRNSLQCIVIGLGFLAIGKNRLFAPSAQRNAAASRSSSRSRS